MKRPRAIKKYKNEYKRHVLFNIIVFASIHNFLCEHWKMAQEHENLLKKFKVIEKQLALNYEKTLLPRVALSKNPETL